MRIFVHNTPKNLLLLGLILILLFSAAGCAAPAVEAQEAQSAAQAEAQTEPQESAQEEENQQGQPAPQEQSQQDVSEPQAAIHFVDDMGNTIEIEEPCRRIVSLYSAHTENLYSLGVGEAVIGVNSTSVYPPDAATKPVYDYKSDPEKVIAAEPDCVLLRPFINRKSPDFVEAIERTDITVISLYPESFDVFDEYIGKLAMMTATQDQAQQLLAQFYQDLDSIHEITAAIEPKQQVYFESTETNYRTVTVDSMAAHAIEYAGGINIASDVEPITEGSSIASYGIEKILVNADKIDVYVSQRGAMNAGGNIHSISIREGFENIKAVQDGRILEINEKIVSSPTLRFKKGVIEMARLMYPQVMDEIETYRSDELLTRSQFANIMVRYTHRPIYLPSSSKYYQQEHDGHVFGLFSDVPWTDPDFDAVETAVQAGWLDGYQDDNGEYFDKEGTVTRDELAKVIYVIGDYERQEAHIQIEDLEQADNAKIIQILVDNQVLTLEEGKFNPGAALTGNQVIDILESL